jgi:hypothetical protein
MTARVRPTAFTIYDSGGGPGVVAGPMTNSPVAVSNGLFTVKLDFGAGVFTGAERWLEIGVRSNGGGDFTALSPRQPLTPTPYAITAANLAAGASPVFTGTPAFNASGGPPFQVASTSVVANLNADLLDGVSIENLARLNATQMFTGSNTFLGGLTARDAAGTGGSLRVGAPVAGIEPKMIWFGDGQFVGVGERGQDDRLDLVGNQIVLTRANGAPSFVGIGVTNPAVALAINGTIQAGSAQVAVLNATNLTADAASVNALSVNGQAFGGEQSTNAGSYSFIGGGLQNQISAGSEKGTIGGGSGNAILSSAVAATIPGGQANVAAGDYSLAAGIKAQALHPNSFVWNSANGSTFSSTAAGQFAAQAYGGVRFEAPLGMTLNGQPLLAGTISADVIQGGTLNVARLNVGENNSVSQPDSGIASGKLHSNAGTTSFIGGGQGNTIAAGAMRSVIGGGLNNQIQVVDGGTIPGGHSNIVAGDTRFAAGRNARALHADSFVWNSALTPLESQTNGHFAVRAYGGMAFDTSNKGLWIDGQRALAGTLTASSVTGGVLVVDGVIAGLQVSVTGTDSAVLGRLNNTNEGSRSVIGGGHLNHIESGSWHTVLGGGINNRLLGSLAVLGGGADNTVLGDGAVVAGGSDNVISNQYLPNNYSTISGGFSNRIANSSSATISGGQHNTIESNAFYSVIGGGYANLI